MNDVVVNIVAPLTNIRGTGEICRIGGPEEFHFYGSVSPSNFETCFAILPLSHS